MACPDAKTLTEQLARLRPREILVAEDWDRWCELWPGDVPQPAVTPMPSAAFSPSAGEQRLRRVLGVGSLRGFGLNTGERLVGMAGALVGYVESTQHGSQKHLHRFVRRFADDGLVLDGASLRNLEIERACDGTHRGSLVAVLDHTLTRMGSRLLRDWLVRPSVDLETIGDRHRAVAELVDDTSLLEGLRASLEHLPDLERLAARVGLSLVTPRELGSLHTAVDLLPGVAAAVHQASSPLLRSIAGQLDPLEDLANILCQRLAENPAPTVGGGVIRSGWDHELDEQRQLARGGKELLSGIERAERESTGIGSLKIRYNKVFGYYIEVSKANLDRETPDPDQRRALRHPGAQGAGVPDPRRRGGRHRPREGALGRAGGPPERARQEDLLNRPPDCSPRRAGIIRGPRKPPQLLSTGHGGESRAEHHRRPPPGARAAPARDALRAQ